MGESKTPKQIQLEHLVKQAEEVLEALKSPDSMASQMVSFYSNTLDFIILDVIVETKRILALEKANPSPVHKTVDSAGAIPTSSNKEPSNLSQSDPTIDIFGQQKPTGKLVKGITECPVCSKRVSLAYFAPHLEKCMQLTERSRRRL